MTIESIIPEQLDQPGTHVLVIGVSQYRHFEGGTAPTTNGTSLRMKQLSAAARSASEFAAWMLNEYNHSESKLSSLRVLLSPSDGETLNSDINGLLDGDSSATLANAESALLGFRKACNAHKENVAIVYVAGHGVQLTGKGSVLLLEDCASDDHINILKGALDMAGIHAGFDHTNTAQTQFWFVDACRQKPAVARRFEEMEGGLSLDEPLGFAQSNPMFLAAATGTEAYARIQGVTLFNEALLWSLRGNNASAPEEDFSNFWHVSVQGLVKRLGFRVQALAEAENAEQTVSLDGNPIDAVLHEYEAPPSVDLQIDILPETAAASCKGSLRHDVHGILVNEQNSWPIEGSFEAGLYEIQVTSTDEFKSPTKFVSLTPPDENPRIDVTP